MHMSRAVMAAICRTSNSGCLLFSGLHSLGSPSGQSSQRRSLRTGLRGDPTESQPYSAVRANLPEQHRPGTTRRITVRGLGVEPRSPKASAPDEPGISHSPAEPPVQPPKRSTRNSLRLSNHDDHLEHLPGDVPDANGMQSWPSLAEQAAVPRTARNSMRLSSHLTRAEHRADAWPDSDGMLTDDAPLPRMTRNSTRLSNPVDSVKDGHGALLSAHAELDQADGPDRPVARGAIWNSMRLTPQPEPTRRLRHHDSHPQGEAPDVLQSGEAGTAQQGMSGARNASLRHEDPLFPTASRKTRSKLARQLSQQSQPSIPHAALPDSGPKSLDAADAAHAEPSCADSPTGQHEGDDVMTRQDPSHDNNESPELAAHAASSSDAMHQESRSGRGRRC